MVNATTRGARRGRGRPARLSPEQIVAAAVALLEHDPDAPLTIKQVADAVGAAPMALYRYFPDREALMQAAADHVIVRIPRITLPDGPWQDQLRAYMRGAQERLRPYRQLLPYMTASEQPAWLPLLIRMADLLAPVGLDDENFALSATLISATIIGHAGYENHGRLAQQTAALQDALASRTESERAAVGRVLPLLPAANARLHDTLVNQTIATIASLGRGPVCEDLSRL